MKKWIWIGAIAVVAIFLYVTYNGFVVKEEAVKTAWSKVETQYQRRADLIPNLVNTVKGYAAHESATLQGVVEARAKATSMTLSVDHMTPESLEAYQHRHGQHIAVEEHRVGTEARLVERQGEERVQTIECGGYGAERVAAAFRTLHRQNATLGAASAPSAASK